MATGGIKALGAARRGLIKRQQQTNIFSGILDTAATVTAFGAGQKKKADTAWGEYEKGYEALGGTDPITRPEFRQKGWFKSTFKGPEGEVSIGEGKARKTYDIANVRKAGAFLGSDAATALFSGDEGEKMRASYIKRTAPGRLDPIMGKFQSPLTQMTGDTGTGFGQGPGMGFKGLNVGESLIGKNLESKMAYIQLEGQDGKFEKGDITRAYGYGEGYKAPIGIQHELTGKDFQPSIAVGERGRDAAGTTQIQAQQRQGAGTYRGPGGQVVDPNPFANLEQSYGDNLYGPNQGNLPESIGYGQSEYLKSIWANQVPWSQQYEDIKKKNLMREGVQQNPYQPGSPWEPDVGAGERNTWDSLKLNNKNRGGKIY